jgi:hypothetical protein
MDDPTWQGTARLRSFVASACAGRMRTVAPQDDSDFRWELH